MNWLSVVGLVRADTARVTVETDRFANRTVPLRGAAGFPWKAFALAPARTDRRGTDRRHAIRARDETGAVLQRVELSWAWRAPCEERRRCSRAQRRGRWAETRDPNAEKEAPFIRRGGGARVKRIATDHPAVQQIVAGQPFSFDGVAVWTKCKGDAVIGGVAEIRLSRPVHFEGDVQAHGYRNGSEYLEGIWHLRIQHAIGFRIYVDLKRGRVVGISPHDDTLDGREGGRPAMKIDYTLVQPLRPVGTDSGDCESKPGA
jgi:hypothetical protein